MLFLCAGAFESALRPGVPARDLAHEPRQAADRDGARSTDEVEIREYFTLRHHFKQEDLFDYGMQPQFLSRFDNAIILEDLHAGHAESDLYRYTDDCVFRASQSFFQKYKIDLEITDDAVRRIADEAAKSAPNRRSCALKAVYGRIIKPFEFDPYAHPEVQASGQATQAGHRRGHGAQGHAARSLIRSARPAGPSSSVCKNCVAS